MGKGVSFHPQFIEDVVNDCVPTELKSLVRPWHKTKWLNNPPLYMGSEYYTNLTPKSYRNKYLKALATIRMYKLREELTKPNKKKIVTKKNEVRILKQVQKSQKYLTIKRCCLLLGISTRKFLALKREQKIRECTPELYLTCNKIRKNQLTTKEVFAIKKVLEDKKLLSWPVSKLNGYCVRNSIVTASYKSWLMVKNLFEINRDKFKAIKMANKRGIRASAPNELLHTDVSRFVLQLNKKVYLFLMIDNYSRFILNAVLAEKISHEMNILHLIQAIQNIDGHSVSPKELMSDQGSENTAKGFLEKIRQYGITHIIAQKDKPFSNSMIERVFASIKKFIRNKFQNFEITVEQLKNAISEFVKMHNYEMPLFKSFKTPNEIYWNIEPQFNYTNEISNAKVRRFYENSGLNCLC